MPATTEIQPKQIQGTKTVQKEQENLLLICGVSMNQGDLYNEFIIFILTARRNNG